MESSRALQLLDGTTRDRFDELLAVVKPIEEYTETELREEMFDTPDQEQVLGAGGKIAGACAGTLVQTDYAVNRAHVVMCPREP